MKSNSRKKARRCQNPRQHSSRRKNCRTGRRRSCRHHGAPRRSGRAQETFARRIARFGFDKIDIFCAKFHESFLGLAKYPLKLGPDRRRRAFRIVSSTNRGRQRVLRRVPGTIRETWRRDVDLVEAEPRNSASEGFLRATASPGSAVVSTTFGAGRSDNSSGEMNAAAGSGTGAPFFLSCFSIERRCFTNSFRLISSWPLMSALRNFRCSRHSCSRANAARVPAAVGERGGSAAVRSSRSSSRRRLRSEE